jgi:hypothetical protein
MAWRSGNWFMSTSTSGARPSALNVPRLDAPTYRAKPESRALFFESVERQPRLDNPELGFVPIQNAACSGLRETNCPSNRRELPLTKCERLPFLRLH